MRRNALTVLLLLAGVANAQYSPTTPAPTMAPMPSFTPSAATTTTSAPIMQSSVPMTGSAEPGLFESDRAFSRFIGPISNPVHTKDPRSLTELRGLFIANWIPESHPVLGGGNFQAVAAQARIALTDRLTFIADKDGYLFLNPRNLPATNGWLNIAAGLKYAFIRDVENQFLVTGGFMYELQNGEAKVFQNHGAGVGTVFATVGKEFNEVWHVILNGGYQFGLNSNYNSSLFFAQAHLDRQFFGWLYPLAEVNWYGYTAGGDRGLPSILGEGDGLINFGTSGVAGNNLVTGAVGLKAVLGQHVDVGVAYEFPLSSRKDLLNDRILVELILRY